MKSQFESNKEFVFPWIITIMMGCLFVITLSGCDNYDEGDQKAAQSFEKMTIVEKGLYDAVEDVWGQSYLVNVRQAVFAREVKPLEESIPFIDIANVIKSNNDITLKVEEHWSTDNKNKSIKNRWDRLDGKWYLQIVNKLGLRESDIVKQDFIIDEVIPDKPSKDDKDKPVVIPDIKRVIERPTINTTSIRYDTGNDIISMNEYDDLYYDLRGCEPAIERYNEIIRSRLVTNNDKEYLIELSIKCKAIKIGEKLNP